MTQYEHAMAMASYRIAVFPCRGNKAPYTAKGFHDASIDPEQIRQWWSKWPDAKIGYLPKSATAICVDLDEGGPDAIRRIIEIAEAKPWCIVPSGTKGRYHILFMWSGEVPITEGAWSQPWGSGDIRYQDGYLIAHYPELLLHQMTTRADPCFITESIGRLKAAPAADIFAAEQRGESRSAAEPTRNDAEPKANGSTPPPNDFGVVPYEPSKYPATIEAAAAELSKLRSGRRTYLNGATYKFAERGATDAELDQLLDAIRSTGYPNMKDAARCHRLATDDGRKVGNAKQKKKSDATFDVTDVGLVGALAHIGYTLKFDIRRQQILWRRANGEWQISNDRLCAKIRLELERHCYRTTRRYGKKERTPYELNDSKWKLLRDAVAYQNEIDPFIDWLERLPKWDGNQRLHQALNLVLGADDTPLNRFASASILIGAVRRAYEPGCEHKTMAVFIGDQHIGKSSYLQWLMPKHHRSAWIGERLPVKSNARDLIEALLGNVIVEYAELGDVGWNIEHLKAFLSTRTDKVRLAWRTDAEEMPRRCILVGTSNPRGGGELPSDPSGLVRFIAVRVSGCAQGAQYAQQWMDDNRAQLWSEALAAYQGGADSNLPAELIEAQDEANLAHRETDDLYETPLRRLIVRGSITGDLLLVDIANQLRHEEPELIREVAFRRLAQALLHLGAQKVRTRTADGVQKRLWRMPVLHD